MISLLYLSVIYAPLLSLSRPLSLWIFSVFKKSGLLSVMKI